MLKFHHITLSLILLGSPIYKTAQQFTNLTKVTLTLTPTTGGNAITATTNHSDGNGENAQTPVSAKLRNDKLNNI